MINPQSSGNRDGRQIEWCRYCCKIAPLAALLALLGASLVRAPAFQATHPITGRHIANVMGYGGADWLERPERESEENLEGALNAIGLKPGMTVAEVGAGTGYVSLRMAKRVGATGKVYANDLQPQMLILLRNNAVAGGVTNVETVVGSETDPKLPPGRMDLIILVDVYHEFSQPQKMLQGIRQALKPDGRLVQLEYRKEDPAIPILADHKMSVAQAKTEVEAEGFKLGPVIEILPRQHILIYTKAAAAGAAAGK
ncbi:MAG: methyltransferase domain-containing protein [Acidobacteriota bacterium]